MSGKAAKAERQAEAAATVASDPKALWQAQVALIRLDGVIEGLEKSAGAMDATLSGIREAVGTAKAERRKLLAEVERMQKAAGIDGKSAPSSPEPPAPAA